MQALAVRTPALTSRLPQVGTTIFTLMSALATQHGAVNLGQGFPDFDCDPALLDAVQGAMREGLNQYPPMTGVPLLRQRVADKIAALYGHRYGADAEITITADTMSEVRHVRSEAHTQRQVRVASDEQRHEPDPHGHHLLVLADGPDGYARLSRALSLGHLAGEKGSPQFALADLADTAAGRWWVLTGCRKGTVPAALLSLRLSQRPRCC